MQLNAIQARIVNYWLLNGADLMAPNNDDWRGDWPDRRRQMNLFSEHDDPPSRWVIDKKIPLSLLFALIVQTAGLVGTGIFYVAQTDGRLRQLETQQVLLQQAPGRLSVIEKQIDGVQRVLERLEDRINNYMDGGRKEQP